MVAINSALAWKLVIANDTIKRAAEALDRVAEAEQQLAEAQAAYEKALRLFRIAADDEGYSGAGEDIRLQHEGAVLLSLVCHKEALEASRKYGFDMQRAMEYGFRTWAKQEDGRRFIRYASRRLRNTPG